jgi:uridine kinase
MIGSASGKTTVCQMIDKRLGTQRVVIISLDSYYLALNPEQIEVAHRSEYNFGTELLFFIDFPVCLLVLERISVFNCLYFHFDSL